MSRMLAVNKLRTLDASIETTKNPSRHTITQVVQDGAARGS